MSAEAVGWVYRHSPYRGAAFAVHLAIADSVNDQHAHKLFIAQGQLAKKSRVGRPKVNEILQEMVADGLLDPLKINVGKPNEYRFLYPDLPVVYETRRRGVASDDTPDPSRRITAVAHDDTPVPPRVSPHTTGVSSEATGGVVSADTDPKRTQGHPKSSPSTPSTATDGAAEEEVLVESLYKALPGRIPQIDRLRRDAALPELHQALRELDRTGWPPAAAAAAMVADPLDDARSLARVLASRARHLATVAPPGWVPPLVPDRGCDDCGGTGWLAPTGNGVDVAPCPCRQAA